MPTDAIICWVLSQICSESTCMIAYSIHGNRNRGVRRICDWRGQLGAR